LAPEVPVSVSLKFEPNTFSMLMSVSPSAEPPTPRPVARLTPTPAVESP
jgi:hypothetical protein